MSNLTLKNINKVYPNGFQAVYDFNLDIKHGEFIVLVGPSGCGKSTTLRMIAGLEDITSGDFYIEDVRANQLTPKQRGIAMVFQSYALYPHLSVYENLAFGLTLQGLDEDIIEEKVINVARILGLSDYLDRKPRALSGGQRQRVAVGRAIIRKVDIFLMDEPLSNLDAKQRVTMRSEISMLHRQVGATTIYVTHDQIEAMTMADRIVVMKDGYIQQVGTPEELYFKPVNTFVAGFIGEPPMNFVNAHFYQNKLQINGTDLVYDLSDCLDMFNHIEDNVDIIFGFRPEAAILEKYQAEGVDLTSVVELTEMLGDSANIYTKIGNQNVILKVDPHDIPKIDDECKFTIKKESIYLFNKETGKVYNK